MAYNRPILIELVADFRFALGTLPATTHFDLANQMRTHGQANIELVPQMVIGFGAPNMGQMFQPAPNPKIRCWNQDRNRVVQIRDDGVSVNHVGAYQGWDSFKELAINVFNDIATIVPGSKLEIVGLNAVDKMDVPLAGYTLGRYLNCRGPFIPPFYQDCSEACDLSMGRGNLAVDDLNSIFVIAARINDDTATVQFNTIMQKRWTSSDINSVLEELHLESNSRFESMITDETRAFMGGVKS